MTISSHFNIDEKDRKEIEKVLEDREKQLGISFELTKPEGLKYLTMPLEELRKLPLDKLSDAIFEITRYAMYTQRIINKNKAWERWATSKLDEITAMNLDNVSPTFGWNERMLIAKTKPELCKKLNSFLRQIRMENDRLYDMPNQLFKLADSVKDIKFSIIQQEKNYGKE